jgi:hypothetical protein
MGKTETIKQRRVDVYLRTAEQKDRWNRYAESQKTSLSKVIIATMESLIGGGLMDQLDAKETLTKRNQGLVEELGQVQAANHRLEKYVELLESELNRAKNTPFSEPGPGIRQYNGDLIKILKSSDGPISNNEILSRARIDPADTGTVSGISAQLEALTAYGLVKYSSRGWTWIG